MFKWLRFKRSPEVSRMTSSSSHELDFTNPDQEKFVKSLNSWRKSLEQTRAQDTKLDQNDLTFMSPEALDALHQRDALIKKEAMTKKRATTLERKAAVEKASSKTTTKTTTKTTP